MISTISLLLLGHVLQVHSGNFIPGALLGLNH